MTDNPALPDSPDSAGALWRVVTVSGVEMELPSPHPQILLTEVEAPWRTLRIPVGLAEGSAIAYAWRALETPRPLTHELMSDLLDRHGVEVVALRITTRQGGTFLAELETTGPRGRQVVPCRPSDGIALVLRRRLPTVMTVAEGLFEPYGDQVSAAALAAEAALTPEPEPAEPAPAESTPD
ncbi:MAG TPA: bifunctional nuclease family protein [Acidimicrobiales bacterium]|nr:bifunctional nuclease family protein [Acidimicrobiales bacterium]